MYKTTVRKRDLFFKYLEEEGLVPQENYSILEVAPNVIVSQSLLLAQKYGELYKHFLVSKRFEPGFDYAIPVDGIRGMVESRGSDVIVRADNKGLRSYLNILAHEPFDTLLIQGQPEEAYSLFRARQYLLFGDVCEIGDRETRDTYNDLLRMIRNCNICGDEYELCHDTQSVGGAEYYLIRSKLLRKPQ